MRDNLIRSKNASDSDSKSTYSLFNTSIVGIPTILPMRYGQEDENGQYDVKM